MGHKTHPVGFRMAIDQKWQSKWFSITNFKKYLEEDAKIRTYVNKKLKRMGLSLVEIERSAKKTKVTLHVSKPGLIIGRGGSGIDELRKELNSLVGSDSLSLSVTEVKVPFISAQIVAEEIAGQIERRVPEKKILNGTVEKVMDAGAKGAKVAISGRIAGQEIARTVYKAAGSIPLQNLSSDIDFARAVANTKYGTLGIKVWVNKGLRKEEPKKKELNTRKRK